jgi:hypothetical protein
MKDKPVDDDSVPRWRRKPTVEGWYVCFANDPTARVVCISLDRDRIDEGAPFGSSLIYGPLPEVGPM